MKLMTLGLCAAFAVPAFAQSLETNFTLEKRGNQVCRIQSGKFEQCLPTVESLEAFGKQPDGYELVAQLKKWKEIEPKLDSKDKPEIKPGELGGAFLVEPARADLILKTFSRLSLRNLAIQLDESTSTSKKIPFFASIYWISASFPYPNGTIHIEGYLDSSKEMNLNLENAEDIRRQIEDMIQVQGIADSNTEQNLTALRLLESAGRSITFRVIGREGQSIDEATVSLVKEVAGPMIFGQVVIAPVAEQMANELGKAIAEALAKAIEEGLKDAIEKGLQPK